MEHTYETTEHGPLCRVRWVYDEHYQTVGSYCYDTTEETEEAEREELAKLESGEWVALGAIVETRATEAHPWTESDSLWGIVVESDPSKLREFAEHSLDLSATDEGDTIARAREAYASDSIEIDDAPAVSRGTDGGAFVAAWVWVADPEPAERCPFCETDIPESRVHACKQEEPTR